MFSILPLALLGIAVIYFLSYEGGKKKAISGEGEQLSLAEGEAPGDVDVAHDESLSYIDDFICQHKPGCSNLSDCMLTEQIYRAAGLHDEDKAKGLFCTPDVDIPDKSDKPSAALVAEIVHRYCRLRMIKVELVNTRGIRWTGRSRRWVATIRCQRESLSLSRHSDPDATPMEIASYMMRCIEGVRDCEAMDLYRFTFFSGIGRDRVESIKHMYLGGG